MSIIKIGGIDPSLRNSGFGIIEYDDVRESINVVHCGVMTTPQKFKKLSALIYMIEGMVAISERKAWKNCDNVVIEFPAAIYPISQKPGMSKEQIKYCQIKSFSAGSIPPVAGVAGACIAAFQDNDRVIPVYPSQWNRTRKKEETKNILIEYLGNPEDWQWDFKCIAKNHEHVFDALGMAFWILEEYYFKYPDD